MLGDSRNDDNATGTNRTILICHSATAQNQQFNLDLASMKRGSAEWNDFIKSNINGDNEILKILSFQEVGSSGSHEWLEWLFTRSQTESRATILSSIYDAIQRLGGFTSVSDYLRALEDPDASRRCAALILLYSMEREDAVRVLCGMLKHDPDFTIRREAAVRLAYLGSHDGLQELLNLLDEATFGERVRAACALCVLGNAVGIDYLRDLLRAESGLSMQERTQLVFSLPDVLSHYGVEWYQCGAEPEVAARLMLNKASEWIASVSKGAVRIRQPTKTVG